MPADRRPVGGLELFQQLGPNGLLRIFVLVDVLAQIADHLTQIVDVVGLSVYDDGVVVRCTGLSLFVDVRDDGRNETVAQRNFSSAPAGGLQSCLDVYAVGEGDGLGIISGNLSMQIFAHDSFLLFRSFYFDRRGESSPRFGLQPSIALRAISGNSASQGSLTGLSRFLGTTSFIADSTARAMSMR